MKDSNAVVIPGCRATKLPDCVSMHAAASASHAACLVTLASNHHPVKPISQTAHAQIGTIRHGSKKTAQRQETLPSTARHVRAPQQTASSVARQRCRLPARHTMSNGSDAASTKIVGKQVTAGLCQRTGSTCAALPCPSSSQRVSEREKKTATVPAPALRRPTDTRPPLRSSRQVNPAAAPHLHRATAPHRSPFHFRPGLLTPVQA